jgi:hypothetical protein
MQMELSRWATAAVLLMACLLAGVVDPGARASQSYGLVATTGAVRIFDATTGVVTGTLGLGGVAPPWDVDIVLTPDGSRGLVATTGQVRIFGVPGRTCWARSPWAAWRRRWAWTSCSRRTAVGVWWRARAQ